MEKPNWALAPPDATHALGNSNHFYRKTLGAFAEVMIVYDEGHHSDWVQIPSMPNGDLDGNEKMFIPRPTLAPGPVIPVSPAAPPEILGKSASFMIIDEVTNMKNEQAAFNARYEVYGADIDSMTPHALIEALKRVTAEIDNLKGVAKTVDSTHIKGRIKELKAMRRQIVEVLDAK